MLLKGKAGLITGAGEGIGEAMATMFARDGAQVAVLDRNREQGEATAAKVRDEGGNAIFLETDVSDEEAVAAAVKACMAAFGRLDFAVNNAARSASFALTADTEARHWDQTQNVSLKGV